MFETLAYYATVLHRSFTAYTTSRLQALGLSFGSLFPILFSLKPSWIPCRNRVLCVYGSDLS